MVACTTPRASLLSGPPYVVLTTILTYQRANFVQTQDRMLKSAENWMAGFFGLEWLVMFHETAHIMLTLAGPTMPLLKS